MTPVKHLLNTVLEMKSNKNNLKQGDVFLNNKKKFSGFNKVEAFTCIAPTNDQELSKKYNFSDDNMTVGSLEDSNFDVTFKKCASDYKGKPIASVCDGEGQPFKVSGCDEMTLAGEIRDTSQTWKQKKDALLTEIGKKYNDENGDPKVHYNVRDKKGNTYYLNLDGQYYKYENAIGESTFNPSHVDFSNTCPKTAPKFIKNSPYIVEGKIDPTSSSGNNKCRPYKDPVISEKYAEIMAMEKKIKDLTEQNRQRTGEAGEGIIKRNKAAILLSHKINEYNELVEQSKKITNDIKSFDTSRSDFLKSITSLQIQYGVVGLTSIALIYLTIKMMSNNES